MVCPGHGHPAIHAIIAATIVTLAAGAVDVKLNLYPALIYRLAPAQTPVLNIVAFDNETNDPVSRVTIADGSDGEYFNVRKSKRTQTQWAMTVKKTIDKPVGYVYDFNVHWTYNGTSGDEHVKINVTEKNVHKPTFDQPEYEFLALRQAVDYDLAHIGAVRAVDNDTEPYNSVFHYHIMDPVVRRYFTVDLYTGDVDVLQRLPPDVTNMTFVVTAIDGGSPQLLNTTRVTVRITDNAPPDVFCVAVEDTIARICWKDPTNGSYVMKYELLFQLDGQNTTTIPIRVDGVRDETCSIVRGAQLHRNYTFTVRVSSGLEWSPESLQRKVIVTRKGLYGDCPVFSNCSIWEPCQNGGKCLVHDDLSYTCNCSRGWGGQNCTGRDLCAAGSPCNTGDCHYQGDNNYTCSCPSTHYGNYCQYYNQCSEIPCMENAECRLSEKSNYTCMCKDHFVGENCNIRDPCSPSPCFKGECAAVDELTATCDCPNGYSGEFCQIENTCILKKPCFNGICHVNNNHSNSISSSPDADKFWCECKQGYHGHLCEKVNICEVPSDTPWCKNHATCTYKEVNSYECTCLHGYWGRECQHYDKCVETPCTAGTCKNTSDDTFNCECDGGHFGRHCERYDPCHERPCQTASSTCVNVSGTDYRCDCPIERYGKNCEKINGCESHVCQHNAVCRNVSDDGDVYCQCEQGYVGKYCEDYDACSIAPCENGGTCTNASRDFECACAVGYRGYSCQYEDPCASAPCWNNGDCSPDGDSEMKYHCTCATYFYGTHCEFANFCHLHPLCLNDGTCSVVTANTTRDVPINIGENHVMRAAVKNWYTCSCRHGYSGEHCEYLSPCSRGNLCGEGACQQRGQGHICYCPDGSERSNCEDGYCDEDSTYYDNTGWYVWPRTRSGESVKVTCHYGPGNTYSVFDEQDAVRECSVNPDGVIHWTQADSDNCKPLEVGAVSRNLHELASRTEDAAGLDPAQIANITTLLEEFFFFSFASPEIAETLTRVVGNLLDANETALIESNSLSHSSERLVWLLDEYAAKVETAGVKSIVTDNVHLEVVSHARTDTGYHYRPRLERGGVIETDTVFMSLPREALTSTLEDPRPRIHFLTYRSSSFFIPKDNAPPQDVVMKQYVVTAVVQGRQLLNLSVPVEIRIKNIEDGQNHTCVYWDVENRNWSSEGVVTSERARNFTRCHSYHLTSFAVLLDPTPTYVLPAIHEQVLTYISYVGCGVSMLGLLLTIITYSIFRCLNREKSGKILMNLCASMLLMNVVFVVGSESSLSVSGITMCKAVAILLHYFLLSTLMWMFVEAINMYQALITVFTKYSGYFMLKRCLLAWGLPAVIVIVTVAVDHDIYKTNSELCFLSHGNALAFFVALLGPACIILLVNIAVFVMVARVILRPKFHGNVNSASDRLNPAQIRGAFTVMALLGVTWVFGPFAINEAKLVVNYVFTILNSLQGFLIFIFRCCFNPEVRMAWIMLIKTGKFKRRKGPIKSYTSDTNSSNKLNGSFADTSKSNVYNSTGKPRNGHAVSKHENQARNDQRKASKDLSMYFDDIQRYGDGNHHTCRNGSTHSLYRDESPDEGKLYQNGKERRYSTGREGGETTIYSGKHKGVRRISSYGIDSDENTKL